MNVSFEAVVRAYPSFMCLGWRRSRVPDLPTGTITLLFTDIEGSTRLLQQVGGLYSRVLTECRDLLRTAFRQWNGHEVDTQGDAFFVAFTHATDAVSAAVHVQRTLAAHSWSANVALRVRIGIHTGEPERSTEGYVGLAVHQAARIMNAAHGGQILLSQTTRDLVEHDLPDRVSLRDMGTHRIKDLQHPSHLYQLVIPGLPDAFPPLRTLDTHSNNLPTQLTSLIGREQEVATVQRLLNREDVHLLTLTGPGGTGKTRLGLQVAAELTDSFVDGVYFVNLAPIRDPSLVIPTIAQTLALKENADQPLTNLLKAYLRDRHFLLLLDNFEQVISAAIQVANLLAACPRLKVIVTSREVLHVQGEHEFAVSPLAVPAPTYVYDLATLSQYEAVTLFISRAQAAKPDFQVTNANAPAVAEICIRLDGLPLAIELAAARIKLLSPQALLARLSQRLLVLTGGARDAPERQQTLRNTIEWSYNLLDPNEQRLFRRISYSFGGSTLEAAEAICTEPGDREEQVLNGVASLIDKSLLQQTEAGEWPRLLMLETVREYALERLAASNEEMEKTWQAHALYYLELAEQAALELRGPQQAVWLERLEIEHDNLRAAMRWVLERWEKWHHGEMALRLGGALEPFWQMRSYLNEGQDFLQRALAGSEGANPSLRAKALNAAGNLALDQYDLTRAEVLCEQSLLLYRELGNKQGIATSLYTLGLVAHLRSQYEVARSLYEESLVLFKEVGDRWGIASALSHVADLAFAQGDYTRSYALIEESLAHFKELSDKWSIGYILLQVVGIASYQGEYARTHALAEESLAIHRELGDKEGIALALHQWGGVFLNQGDYARAGPLLQEGLAIYRELSARRGVAGVLFCLGRVALGQGDYATAQVLLQESLRMFKELDNKWLMTLSLEELGAVVALQGQPVWAARLVGAAEAFREAIGGIPQPANRSNYEHGLEYARNQLGEKVFAKALAEGRTMTPEQALAAQESVTPPIPTSAEPPPDPPVKPSATYPDGLTAREVGVLCLLAQGLTDRQIAEQLIISPRTVNTHLTSIYGKIQVSSRSAATRYAIEHQLF